MNLTEALEWAADYAERNNIFAPVTNSRGYSDGWKPPTPQEKSEIIQKLAQTVYESEQPKSVAGDMILVTYLEGAVTELRRLRAGLQGPTADQIQELSNRLDQLAKEIKGASGSN